MSASDLARKAEELYLQPLNVSNQQAQTFMEQFPFDVLVGILGTNELAADQVAVISKALLRVLSTPVGQQLVLGGLPYLEAARQSQHVALRKLGCDLLGCVLRAAPEDSPQRAGAVAALVEALEDPDTGVAAAAVASLVGFSSTSSAHFLLLLQGLGRPSERLSQLASSTDAVVRARALELLLTAAGKAPDGSALIRRAGVLDHLFAEFTPEASSSDPLSVLARLHMLRDLAESGSSSLAVLLCELMLPRLLPLLEDPTLRTGALPVAATMVAHAGPEATQLPGASQLVRVIADMLDEAGDYSHEDEVVALDAAGQMGLADSSAELLLRTPQVAARLLGRALSLSSPSALRVAALHAVASLAGAARAVRQDQPNNRPAAELGPEAEEQLRVHTYMSCSSSSPPRTPSEAVLTLLTRPFPEIRIATYRFLAALAVRSWFAHELLNNPTFIDRLLNPSSEAGQQLSEWRHSAVVALNWGLGNGGRMNGWHGADEDAGEVLEERVAKAAKAGPYGLGLEAFTQTYDVASLPS